ncbi:MAG: hypothetical protein ABH836_00980 [Candidatus Omnitrophota bacterium]
MKKYLFVILAVTVLSVPAWAWRGKEEKKVAQNTADEMVISEPQAVQATGESMSKEMKDVLINNINILRNQEVRVAVLQQFLNENIAQLKQTQAVFCDQYNLDSEKFRAGMYVYDEAKGGFVEKEVE